MKRKDELVRFYSILAHLESMLGGKRKLSECSSRTGWPKRGVYFFFEVGERRSGSGMGPRVVRVGTHALKANSQSSLWQRLSQHRGSPRGGNHRGSIFRLLVGDALKTKQQQNELHSWGIGSDPGKAAAKLGITRTDVIERERDLEAEVSQYIGTMPFLWLAIDDNPAPESLRGLIERNAIALLSNYSEEVVDTPSETWLGRLSSRERVNRSGLWNNNHVDEQYEPEFLDRFEKLV